MSWPKLSMAAIGIVSGCLPVHAKTLSRGWIGTSGNGPCPPTCGPGG